MALHSKEQDKDWSLDSILAKQGGKTHRQHFVEDECVLPNVVIYCDGSQLLYNKTDSSESGIPVLATIEYTLS